MTAAKLAEKFGVNIMRDGFEVTKNRRKYHAYTGGNGTGVPVVDIASAYTLQSLAAKLAKIGRPLVEVL